MPLDVEVGGGESVDFPIGGADRDNQAVAPEPEGPSNEKVCSEDLPAAIVAAAKGDEAWKQIKKEHDEDRNQFESDGVIIVWMIHDRRRPR